jgi:hypothetical protein
VLCRQIRTYIAKKHERVLGKKVDFIVHSVSLKKVYKWNSGWDLSVLLKKRMAILFKWVITFHRFYFVITSSLCINAFRIESPGLTHLLLSL